MRRSKGFFRELVSRSNEVVSTMAVISLVISAPVICLSIAALIYDIFVLKYGLTDPSVKLLSAMIVAAAGGLAATQFSKRSVMEMTGAAPLGDKPPPRAASAPSPVTVVVAPAQKDGDTPEVLP